ncbi:MAG: hypothetical protein KUG77_27445 [Nannocystaceae bacterium]|nr:hypothetical protein [Nannocystaceae bacterium]
MSLAESPDMRSNWMLAATLTATLTGCFDTEVAPTPTFSADDVSIDVPTGNFRALGGRGEVMELADEVSGDVNSWVGEMAGSFGEMLAELSKHEPTQTDGDWRIYGPFEADDDDDLTVMVRVEGDASRGAFEVLAGLVDASASDLVIVFSGELTETEDARTGSIRIDFDAIYGLKPLREEIGGSDDFGGAIEVSFDRELESKAKTVELHFDGFHYANDEEDLEYRDEVYSFEREDGGAGSFHFATWGTFDEEGWSGPQRERMTVDMIWDDSESGRARAQVLELEGEGDLLFGDLVLEECFDPGFSLTWAEVNAPYRGLGGYDEGDAAACRVDASALED